MSDVAPRPELAPYLRLMYHALLVVRNYGFSQRQEEALFCGLVADALHRLPEELLSFQRFDPVQFWREVDNLRGQAPPRLAPAWDAIFQKAAGASDAGSVPGRHAG